MDGSSGGFAEYRPRVGFAELLESRLRVVPVSGEE